MKATTRRRRSGRRLSGVVAALTGAALIALLGAFTTPASAWDPSQHTEYQAGTLPMGQANRTVLATQVAGGKIFAGGLFTSTRPAGSPTGTNETGQAYLAAFDAVTGEPVPSFAPKLSNTWNGAPGVVRALALSPDKSTLFVGGDFNAIDGKKAEHIAKFDTATGQFLGQVGVNGVNGQVSALAVSPDGQTLYVGGKFNKAAWGVSRSNIAAFDTATGALKPYVPTTAVQLAGEISVEALAVSSDNTKVFVGGRFQQFNGASMQGFAATYADNSRLVPGFRADYNIPKSLGYTSAIAVKGDKVYLGGHSDGAEWNRNEGVVRIDANTGAIEWDSQCHGDTAAILPMDTDIYVANHTHDCPRSDFAQTSRSLYFAMTALNPDTGIMRPYWVNTAGTTNEPDTMQMSRALATDGSQIVMGGGFNTVNGTAQTNIARFTKGSSAPARAAWPQGTTCDGCDNVTVKVLQAGDRDDMNLTYEIYRNNDSQPVYSETRQSLWYDYSTTFEYVDSLPVGTKVYYRVKVIDAAGNATWSVRTPVYTVGQTTAPVATSSTATTAAQKAALPAAKDAGMVR